ncbi:MAG: M15 family metallopeptidase [Rickettsiales bacterium]|jgi:zinc D-Ala-D-Ala dipeptidase|nr:M15 family metallopeptidase [Rickettsiales bacterium]
MISLKKLSNITAELITNLRYQTYDNVFQDVLYPEDFEASLHEEAFLCLKKAIDIARKENLVFKIWDAYRPYSVQEKMFDIIGDSNFVSNPETGSVPHCRGIAVDLTLCDSSGLELDMGTDFDNFTELAFFNSKDVSERARNHRVLLREIMTLAGFDSYDNEWWHFQLFNPRSYEIING